MRPSSTPSSPLSSSPAVTRRSFTLKAVLAAAGSLGLLRMARAQAPDPTAPKPLADNVSLKDLMTPEEYRAAGLKKLSPEELQRLERFLQGYRERAVKEQVKATEERVNPAPRRDRSTAQNVIEGHIQGHFAGLAGRTRVVLDNGSIWQQIDTAQKFPANLDNPDIVLVRTIFGYKMYVTGAIHWFYVRQIVVR